MGTKMSSSGGSSEQITNSDLTSMALVPHGPLPDPSEPKQQIPNNSVEEDLDGDNAMGAEDLNQTHNEPNSDDHLGSETASRADHQQSEDTPAMADSNSQETSATDGDVRPVQVRRKRGRSRRKKLLLQRRRKTSKKVNAKICLPAGVINHSTDGIPNSVENYSSPQTAPSDGGLNDKTDSSIAKKQRRGRPKKSISAPPPPAPVIVSGPSRSLRSRGQPPSFTPEQAGGAPTENSETSIFLDFKRRLRKRPSDQGVPANMSKQDNSQHALPPLKEEKADEPMELKTDGDTSRQEQLTDALLPLDSEVKLSEDLNPMEYPQLKESINVDENKNLETPDSSGCPVELLVLPKAKRKKSDRQQCFFRLKKGGKKRRRRPVPAGCPVELLEDQPPSTDVTLEETQLNSTLTPPSLEQVLPKAKRKKSDKQQCFFRLKKGGKKRRRRPVPAGCPEELLEDQPPSTDVTLEETELNSTLTPPSLEQVLPKAKRKKSDRQQCFFRLKKGGKKRRRRPVLVPGNPEEKQEMSEEAPQTTECPEVKKEEVSDVNADVTYLKDGKKVHKCNYCGRLIRYLSQFIVHQRIHTGERPFKCEECGKTFSKNSNLNLHLKTHKKNTIYQKCEFCKIRFSASEYTSHMRMHDLEQEAIKPESWSRGQEKSPEPSGEASLDKERKVCQYCGKTFPFQSALVRHIRVHTGEKPYKCDICGKAFGQSYFLRVHELTHLSVKRYNCTRCEKSFAHYSNAKNHTCRPTGAGSQESKSLKPSLSYTCHICKSVFNHLQEFNFHMKQHTGAKLFHCLYCDKLFGALSEFDAHRRRCAAVRDLAGSPMKEEETLSMIHYAVPSLRLHPPGFSPASDADLGYKVGPKSVRRKKHPLSVHTPFQVTVAPPQQLSQLVLKLNKLDNRSDPRKYLCPNCGRQFRHMGRLRAHMLTHASMQTYTCACCGKTLESWKTLWVHQRVHRQRRGRFTCPQCGRGFRFAGAYQQHMSEHPEFRWIKERPRKAFLPYQCDQCRCSFRTLDLLFSHQLCHSSEQEAHKGSHFDLLLDDNSTPPNGKILNSSNINGLSSPHSEERNTSPLSRSHKCPDPERSPLVPVVSFGQSPSLDLDHSSQDPIKNKEMGPGPISRKSPRKPFGSLKPVRRLLTEKRSKAKESSSDVRCAMCTAAFQEVSDLYHHYLQHARGQV